MKLGLITISEFTIFFLHSFDLKRENKLPVKLLKPLRPEILVSKS